MPLLLVSAAFPCILPTASWPIPAAACATQLVYLITSAGVHVLFTVPLLLASVDLHRSTRWYCSRSAGCPCFILRAFTAPAVLSMIKKLVRPRRFAHQPRPAVLLARGWPGPCGRDFVAAVLLASWTYADCSPIWVPAGVLRLMYIASARTTASKSAPRRASAPPQANLQDTPLLAAASVGDRCCWPPDQTERLQLSNLSRLRGNTSLIIKCAEVLAFTPAEMLPAHTHLNHSAVPGPGYEFSVKQPSTATPCKRGYFKPAAGAAKCTYCSSAPGGRGYTDTEGAKACKICPPRMVISATRSSCNAAKGGPAALAAH